MMTIKELLSLLLKTDFKKQHFHIKDWSQSIQFFERHQLHLLFYHIIKNNESCPDDLKGRLHNLFAYEYAKFSRLQHEIQLLMKELKDNELYIGFIKGYPLALQYYPHPACRIMADVDIVHEKSNKSILNKFFKKLGFSIVHDRSPIEKKTQYIKLWGHYSFCIESHEYLISNYQIKPEFEMLKLFSADGTPEPETLFNSILFHHRYFECSYRDFIDLALIIKKHPRINWNKIIQFAKDEKLLKHYLIIKELMNNYLNISFQGVYHKLSIYQFITYPIQKIFRKFALNSFIKKRGLLSQILDAISLFFVYDDLFYALKCFYHKYGHLGVFIYKLKSKHLKTSAPNLRN